MLKKIFFYWLPLAAWCGLIFFLSGIPNLRTDLGFWDFVMRKTAHMFEYAVLFLLGRRAFGAGGAMSGTRLNAAAGIFAVAYAVSDEFHQSFVPTRGPSVADVGIDAVGILLGICFQYAARRCRSVFCHA